MPRRHQVTQQRAFSKQRTADSYEAHRLPDAVRQGHTSHQLPVTDYLITDYHSQCTCPAIGSPPFFKTSSEYKRYAPVTATVSPSFTPSVISI